MKTIFLLAVVFTVFTQTAFCQEEILQDLNRGHFNKDFSDYDQSTAIYCAQVSELIYWKQEQLQDFYRELKALYPEANYQYEFIEHKDKKSHTQVLLLGNKDFLVVAFRGTEPAKILDWISDAKFWNYENNPESNEELANMPPGHGGFRRSLIDLITDEKLFEQINRMIVKCNPKAEKKDFPIYLTGHSLGAAIAQFFIEPLHYKGYHFAGAYHYAPPLAVSCQWRDYMSDEYGGKVYDIINYKDYVPRAGRNGVAHFGKFYRICNDGLIYAEKEAYIKFRFFEYLSEFKLHALGNHLKAIKGKENTAENIISRSVGTYPCLEPGTEITFCP